MGSWYETDAITGVPIGYKEPVIAIVLKNVYRDNIYGLYSYDMSKVKKIVRGAYNLYGNLEEEPVQEEPDEFTIFIKQFVWDELIKELEDVNPDFLPEEISYNLLKKNMGLDYNQLLTSDDMIHFVKILQFCRRNRIDILAGLKFRGSQNGSTSKEDMILAKDIYLKALDYWLYEFYREDEDGED